MICSKSGVIAHHGYTRPGEGWQTASCEGTHHSPLEVTNALLVATIASCEARVEETRRQIANVRADSAPVVVTIQAHWNEKRFAPYVYRFTAETYAEVAAASEGRLSDRVTFADRKSHYLSEIEGWQRNRRAFLAELRKRNENWKQKRVFVDGQFKPVLREDAA
jgi:hypothetical protein